jgi:hypothetical protein
MAVALCAALAFARPADAAVRIIGLPKAGDAAEIQAMVAGLALALPLGDTLMLYDARDQVEIGSISIPNDRIQSRPERKLELILPAMAALKRHLAPMAASKADEPALIHASSFFDAVAPIIAAHRAEGVRILLLGSPWFTAEGALEKKDYLGSFPSDGLILAGRSESPFGTQGWRDLTGATVDYCYQGGGFLNPEHRERVERAWSLLVAQRGGQLTSFSGDTKTCVDRFAAPKAPEAKAFAIDPTDAQKRFMYRSLEAAPRIINAPALKTEQATPPPASDARLVEAARFDQQARDQPPLTRSGTAWVGIQWQEPVDLDLYVRCSASSPFLYYGNQHSPEGRHNLDIQAGSGTEFETVDLTASCPDISKAAIFVNFFEGTVRAPIRGIVAIEFDGGLYKRGFAIPALSGNGGQGLSPSASMGAPYWVKIDVLAVLNLNTRAATRARNASIQ